MPWCNPRWHGLGTLSAPMQTWRRMEVWGQEDGRGVELYSSSRCLVRCMLLSTKMMMTRWNSKTFETQNCNTATTTTMQKTKTTTTTWSERFSTLGAQWFYVIMGKQLVSLVYCRQLLVMSETVKVKCVTVCKVRLGSGRGTSPTDCEVLSTVL